MAMNIDSTLSSYAQQAGVTNDDLNGKNGAAAADKLLAAASQSGDSAAIKDALDIDVTAYAAAHSKANDSYQTYAAHVAQVAPGASADLSAMATSGDISNNTAMISFAAELAKTYAAPGGGNAAGAGMTSMSTDGGGFWEHGLHHNEQTATVSVGSPGSYYKVQYEQKNDTSNQLTVTDPAGNTVSLPTAMQNGNNGTMTLPGGASITVSGSGAQAAMAVSYKGQTQTVNFNTKDNGTTVSSSGSTNSAASTPSGSTGSSPGGTTSSTSGAPGATGALDFSAQQQVDPNWIQNSMTAAKSSYSDPSLAALYGSGATDAWLKEYNPAAPETVNPASLNGAQLKAYQAGQAFAEAFHGGAVGVTPSGSTASSTSVSSTSGSSTSGASTGALDFSAQQQVDPNWIQSAMTNATANYSSNDQALFQQAANDTWTKEYSPNQASVINPATLSPAELKVYQAGQAFAQAYHGGAVGVTPSGSTVSSSSSTGSSASSTSGSSTSGQALDFSNQQQVDPDWIQSAMTSATANYSSSNQALYQQAANDAWTKEYSPNQASVINPATLTPAQLKIYQAGQAFAEAYHGGAVGVTPSSAS